MSTPADLVQIAEILRPMLKPIAQDAADIAVKRTFVVLGIDVSDPASIAKWHANLAWIESQRASQQDTGKALKSMLLNWAVQLIIPITVAIFALWQMVSQRNPSPAPAPVATANVQVTPPREPALSTTTAPIH